MKIDSLVRSNIASLAPYSTARDEYKGELGVYLDANENPYDNGYNRYPDPRQMQLKERISQVKGVAVENIFIGNGSDEPIDLIFRVFCRPSQDNVVVISPSYGMYSVAADINDIEVREVALTEEFAIDMDGIKGAINENTKAVFFCSPNNPSGNLLSREDMLEIATSYNVIVVVDEAYIDFADTQSFVTEIGKHPNIMVLQTLSKAWGMAAVRCGLAIASEQILSYMNKVKYPYNINKLTQEWVLSQLAKEEMIAQQVAQIKSERKKLEQSLETMPQVRRVYPSDANFILVKVDDADRLYNLLIENKVIVRNRSRIKGCEGCLRITVGTPEENSRLIDILSKA